MTLLFNDYQTQAQTFRKPTADLIYAVMGLCEEAGEVAGKFAKNKRDMTDLNQLRIDVVKELGDVLWMVAAIAKDLNVSLEEVAQTNLHKLTSRLAHGTISGQGDNR